MIKLKALLLTELKNSAEVGSQFSDSKTGKSYIITDIMGDNVYTTDLNGVKGPSYSKDDLEFQARTNVISFENPEKTFSSTTKYDKQLNNREKNKGSQSVRPYSDSQYISKIKNLARQIDLQDFHNGTVDENDIYDMLYDLAGQYIDNDGRLSAYLVKQSDGDKSSIIGTLADTVYNHLNLE